jgi:hypothetical protein
MKMTELQFAGMSINLSTLGQVDLSDNDPELLRALAHLLSEASQNVARALHPPASDTEPYPVGARVVVAVAGDMYTGQHATVRSVRNRPRLGRRDYALDIDGVQLKYGAGPYQASEIVPAESDAARDEREHGEPPF